MQRAIVVERSRIFRKARIKASLQGEEGDYLENLEVEFEKTNEDKERTPERGENSEGTGPQPEEDHDPWEGVGMDQAEEEREEKKAEGTEKEKL